MICVQLVDMPGCAYIDNTKLRFSSSGNQTNFFWIYNFINIVMIGFGIYDSECMCLKVIHIHHDIRKMFITLV